jgi:hypothetical protein
MDLDASVEFMQLDFLVGHDVAHDLRELLDDRPQRISESQCTGLRR